MHLAKKTLKLYTAAFCFIGLVAIPALASQPEDIGHKKLILTGTDYHAPSPKDITKHKRNGPEAKKHIPNANAASKALAAAKLPIQLDSRSPLQGGFGDVFLAGNVVVKVSKTHSSLQPKAERDRIFSLKTLMGDKPCDSFRMCWPIEAFEPTLDPASKTKPYLGQQPYMIYIYPRFRAVKSMDAIIQQALNGNGGALQDINAFGQCLGKFQAGSLVKLADGRLVSHAHMDLNRLNIIPLALASQGKTPVFGLIDVGDVRAGSHDNAPEVALDPIYFIHKNVGWYCRPKKAQGKNPPKDNNVQVFAHQFFRGLLGQFSPEIREQLKGVYLTVRAQNIALQRNPNNPRTRVYAAPIYNKYHVLILPVIKNVFNSFLIPKQVAAKAAPAPQKKAPAKVAPVVQKKATPAKK